MNHIMQTITNFFWQLDNKRFNQVLIGSISLLTMSFGLFLYFQFNTIRRLKRTMVTINTERMQTKELLEKNELLNRQKKRAQEIINQDKNFFLKKYFLEIVNKFSLIKNLKVAPVREISLENLRSQGYEEVRIEAEFVNLNMKQLVDFLNELEQNNRISIKRLEITKSKTGQTIDVQMTISTLQQKIEASEEIGTE